jgi:hypothetical protein
MEHFHRESRSIRIVLVNEGEVVISLQVPSSS